MYGIVKKVAGGNWQMASSVLYETTFLADKAIDRLMQDKRSNEIFARVSIAVSGQRIHS